MMSEKNKKAISHYSNFDYFAQHFRCCEVRLVFLVYLFYVVVLWLIFFIIVSK